MLEGYLRDNGLYWKQIPNGANSLMRAVSDALYFSTQNANLITPMLVQYLQKLITMDMLPCSLSIFQTNMALQSDYSKQPNFPGFDLINLELISMMFRVKINLYTIVEGRLTCRTWNNNYLRMIELCRDDNNHYDSVYSRQFVNNALTMQQIIYEAINKSINDVNGPIPKQFKNLEMETWLEGKLDTISTQIKHRSMSDHQTEQQSHIHTEIVKLAKKNEPDVDCSEIISNFKSNPPGLEIVKPQNNDTPKKPVILEESIIRYCGRLKFFDESKSYGFLVLDNDGSDIFVHQDDLQKAGISKEHLRTLGSSFRTQTQVSHFGRGNTKAPYFSFQMMTYVGKYNRSRKAVDLKQLMD